MQKEIILLIIRHDFIVPNFDISKKCQVRSRREFEEILLSRAHFPHILCLDIFWTQEMHGNPRLSQDIFPSPPFTIRCLKDWRFLHVGVCNSYKLSIRGVEIRQPGMCRKFVVGVSNSCYFDPVSNPVISNDCHGPIS